MEKCKPKAASGRQPYSTFHEQKGRSGQDRSGRKVVHASSTHSVSTPSTGRSAVEKQHLQWQPVEDISIKLQERATIAITEFDHAYQRGDSWPQLLRMIVDKYQELHKSHKQYHIELDSLNKAFGQYFFQALKGYLPEVKKDIRWHEGHRHIPLLETIFTQCDQLLEEHTSNVFRKDVENVTQNLIDSELSYLEWRVAFTDEASWKMAMSGVRKFIDDKGHAHTKLSFCDHWTLQSFHHRKAELEKKQKQYQKSKKAPPKNPLMIALAAEDIAAANAAVWKRGKVCNLQCRLMSDYLRIKITEVNESMTAKCDIPGLIVWLNTFYQFCCLCPESIQELPRPRQDIAAVISGVVKKLLFSSHSHAFNKLDKETLKKIKAFKDENLLDKECLELEKAMYSKDTPSLTELTPQFVFQQLNTLQEAISRGDMSEAKELMQVLLANEKKIKKLPGAETLCNRLMRARTALYKTIFDPTEQHLKTLMGRTPSLSYQKIVASMARFKNECKQAAGWEFILKKNQVENWKKTLCKVWGEIIYSQGRQESFSQNDVDELLGLMELVGLDSDLQCQTTRRNLKSALHNLFHLANTAPTKVVVEQHSLSKLATWAEKLAATHHKEGEGFHSKALQHLIPRWHKKTSHQKPATHTKPTTIATEGKPSVTQAAAPPIERPLLPVEQTTSPPVVLLNCPLVVICIPTTTTLAQRPCTHREADDSITLTLQTIMLKHTTYDFDWAIAVNNRTFVHLVNGLNQIKTAIGAFSESNPIYPGAPKVETDSIKPVQEGMRTLFSGLDIYMTDIEHAYCLGGRMAFPVSPLEPAHWRTLFRIANDELAKGNMLVSSLVNYAYNYLLALHVHKGFIEPRPQLASEA